MIGLGPAPRVTHSLHRGPLPPIFCAYPKTRSGWQLPLSLRGDDAVQLFLLDPVAP